MRHANRILSAFIAGTFLAGCNTPPAARLNAPPQGYSESPSEKQEIYVYMNDNAMLSDMSVADIHFVPHRTEINSLGLRSLDRFASLLKVYGGNLRYDTRLSDENLIQNRIANIKEYLAAAGVDLERTDVVVDLPGGRGGTATEAVTAQRNSMVQPKVSGGTAPTNALVPPVLPAAP